MIFPPQIPQHLNDGRSEKNFLCGQEGKAFGEVHFIEFSKIRESSDTCPVLFPNSMIKNILNQIQILSHIQILLLEIKVLLISINRQPLNISRRYHQHPRLTLQMEQ